MTLNDVKKHFGNSYQFSKITGMASINYSNWGKRGYIPIETQLRLQAFTQGALMAKIEDAVPIQDKVSKK